MSEFTTAGLQLCFPHAQDGVAILLEAIQYEAAHKGSGIWIEIEAGSETDGLSVPRILWAILPPFGSLATKAAVLHDWLLYRLAIGEPVPGFETRKAIDDEFQIALLALGVSPARARVAWLLVRSWSLLRDAVPAKRGFHVLQTR